MDEATKAAILKRIDKGIPFIQIQEAYGVTGNEIKKLAGVPLSTNRKKTGKEKKVKA
jgi:hypothetical protein